jgi:phosphomannomutase
MFPNHIPNPEDKTAMKAITQAVLENKADLGIIFDTDVDRCSSSQSVQSYSTFMHQFFLMYNHFL